MHGIARMTLGLTLAGLVCLPTAAFAQMAPTTLVQRTPNYTLVLDIGAVESIVSPMDAMHGMAKATRAWSCRTSHPRFA